ncbi:MAG: MFS transporter [Pseudomonadota bacterium]
MARTALTLASFLAYFVMSSLLAPIGLQLAPLAQEFGLELAAVSAVFGWLTSGVLLGALLAVPLYERVPLRPLVAATYALLAAALWLLPGLADSHALRWGLGLVGALSGIGLAGAALLIAQSYRAAHRTSMLVVTDASFSSAGYIIAPLAGWMLASGGGARDIYLVIAGLALLIALLTALTAVPRVATAPTPDTVARSARTGTTLVFWLCALALLGYTLGQQSLLIWLPTLLTTAGTVDSAEAGVLIGRYWTGMFVAQLLVAVWLLRSGTVLILWLAAWGTLLGATPLVLGVPQSAFGAAMLIWGLANFALLKVVLGFVSDQPGLDLTRVLPRLLFAATSGTALAPVLSGFVAAQFGPRATLGLALGSLSLTAVALTLAILGRRVQGKLSIGTEEPS